MVLNDGLQAAPGIEPIPSEDVRHLARGSARCRVKMAHIPGEDRADLFGASAKR